MQIPEEVEQLCQQFLAEIRQDPAHDLPPAKRKLLYEAFDRSNEEAIWQRIQTEMAQVAADPNLAYIDKTLRREAIYKALAPSRDLVLEAMLQNESSKADKSFFSWESWENIPDYYASLPEVDPIRYRVVSRLGVLTARRILPVWEEILDNAEKEYVRDRRDNFFEEFYGWVEKYADDKSKSVLLEILDQFPRDKAKMRREVGTLDPVTINPHWKAAVLHLLSGNEFEATIQAFLAQGEAAPWVESVQNVSTIELPSYVLFVAENVLNGVISHKAARQITSLTGIMFGNIPEIYELSPLSYDAGRVFEQAFGLTIIGLQEFNRKVSEKPDSSNEQDSGDVVAAAVCAYSDVYSYDEDNEDYEFEGPDLQKRLEFWEWWLSEAIPQAWESTPNPAK